MRVGIFGSAVSAGTIDDFVAEAATAERDGFATYWTPNVFSLDALMALAIAGRVVPRIELGTSVVPTYPRHPMAIAQQALTAQAACGGRLALGIGPSHQVVIEQMYHQSYARPLRHMQEYLEVLMPLLRGEPAAFAGETLGGHGQITVPGASPVPVLISALGPKMLELAGQRTAGTITWCVGPETLRTFTVPTLRAAAEAAGRDMPRVVAGLPVCVTDDPAAARARTAKMLGFYTQLPSYKAMLDREGAAGPQDLLIAGNDDDVHERLAALADTGITDLAAVELGADPDERTRTRAVLRRLLPASA